MIKSNLFGDSQCSVDWFKIFNTCIRTLTTQNSNFYRNKNKDGNEARIPFTTITSGRICRPKYDDFGIRRIEDLNTALLTKQG